MKNKIFEGLTISKVKKDDPKFGKISGAWGLKDNKSKQWMPRAFSKREDNILLLKEDAESILSAPLKSLIHIHNNEWGWDDDNYIPSLFLKEWLGINPGVLELINKRIEENRKAKALKDARRIKRKRGRPKKNSYNHLIKEEPVKRPRGRPRKNPIEETSKTTEKSSISLSKPKRNYVLKTSNKTKRGRKPKIR